jgi:hypothetical protein
MHRWFLQGLLKGSNRAPQLLWMKKPQGQHGVR